MVNERKALHAIVRECAEKEGLSMNVWCGLHGVSYTTVSKVRRSNGGRGGIVQYPSLGTVYAVCNAAGIKPSRFFAAIGR